MGECHQTCEEHVQVIFHLNIRRQILFCIKKIKAYFIIQTKDTSKLRGKYSVVLFTSFNLKMILKKCS